MPIYEYRCQSCEVDFEEMRSISDEGLPHCPKCDAADVKKKVSLSGFHLKGGGWYKDGYASTSDEAVKVSKESKASDSSPKK